MSLSISNPEESGLSVPKKRGRFSCNFIFLQKQLCYTSKKKVAKKLQKNVFAAKKIKETKKEAEITRIVEHRNSFFCLKKKRKICIWFASLHRKKVSLSPLFCVTWYPIRFFPAFVPFRLSFQSCCLAGKKPHSIIQINVEAKICKFASDMHAKRHVKRNCWRQSLKKSPQFFFAKK